MRTLTEFTPRDRKRLSMACLRLADVVIWLYNGQMSLVKKGRVLSKSDVHPCPSSLSLGRWQTYHDNCIVLI